MFPSKDELLVHSRFLQKLDTYPVEYETIHKMLSEYFSYDPNNLDEVSRFEEYISWCLLHWTSSGKLNWRKKSFNKISVKKIFFWKHKRKLPMKEFYCMIPSGKNENSFLEVCIIFPANIEDFDDTRLFKILFIYRSNKFSVRKFSNSYLFRGRKSKQYMIQNLLIQIDTLNKKTLRIKKDKKMISRLSSILNRDEE